jgi:hypothetical protein
MSRAPPRMRDFAERLIAHEAKGNPSSEPKRLAALLVFEKLRLNLTTLMGNVGFRALLSRSLALARTEVPELRSVQVKDDGFFAGMDELGAQAGPEKTAQANAILLTSFLGLLVTFIGENLTLRLVRQIWPKLPLGDLDFSNGVQDEDPKQRR